MVTPEQALSQAQALYNVGLEFHEEKDYNASLKIFRKALDSLKSNEIISNEFSTKIIAAISSVHDKIAALQADPNQYLIDVVLKELGEFPADNSQTIIETSRQSMNIGTSFQRGNQDDIALDYFSRALEIQHKIPGHDYISILFHLVGASCDKLNQQVSELIQATQYQEALKITNQMLDIVKNHSDNKELIARYATTKADIENLINPKLVVVSDEARAEIESDYFIKNEIKITFDSIKESSEQMKFLCTILPYNSVEECIIDVMGSVSSSH